MSFYHPQYPHSRDTHLMSLARGQRFHAQWVSPCGVYRVALTAECYQKMLSMAVGHFPLEIGTALVGEYTDDGWCAVINDIAPLSPDTDPGAGTFTRGSIGLKEFFGRLWASSGGRKHYVGEWHSHPSGSTEPSSIDDEETAAIASAPEYQCAECIQIIMAVGANGASIGAYIYPREGERIDLRPTPTEATR